MMMTVPPLRIRALVLALLWLMASPLLGEENDLLLRQVFQFEGHLDRLEHQGLPEAVRPEADRARKTLLQAKAALEAEEREEAARALRLLDLEITLIEALNRLEAARDRTDLARKQAQEVEAKLKEAQQGSPSEKEASPAPEMQHKPDESTTP